ncbi:tyrosine-type recombinase/integrase [Hymenobacter chitinivorans]|uniref:Phage integrase family protein n=1 Tax=Hymenobacter chitinivorans DSM 11115 TaxID=1121954 RepID=A0A2M9BN89_9BACT|nr:tyrosine-type recombinase/integrase [Hymenobacter chitinivorans]PJJ59402.1 phage integrase family protein [Hymenobacter chitinivorans DSM 11115]
MKITRQLRKDLLNQTGFAPIQVTICWQGNRLRISSGQLCRPEFWDEAESKVMPKKGSHYNHINPVLNSISETAEQALFTAEQQRRRLDKAELDGILKNLLQLPPEAAPATPVTSGNESPAEDEKSYFFQLMAQWVEAHERKVNPLTFRKIAKSTIDGLHATMARFEAYAQDRGVELTLEGMNTAFYNDFRTYVLDELGQEVNTFGKHINRLRSFLAWCEDEQELDVNRKYRKFTAPSQYVGVDALTEQELRRIYKIDFRSLAVQERLLELRTQSHSKGMDLELPSFQAWAAHVELARDKFLECAYTGLRISDAELLGWKHVKGQMIHIKAGKNQHECYIPFYDDDLFHLVELAHKYEDRAPDGLLLPTCYRVNEFLKIVQQLAGITRLTLSSKLGRKTFVTLKLYQGVPTRLVMQSTGHTTERSFNHYVGVDTLKLLQEYARRSPGMPRSVA